MTADPDPTAELVARCSRGDEAARNALFERVAPFVLGLVRRRMGERLRARHESVDLAQSVLADAVSNLERFEYRGEGALHDWLARYVENKLRAHARRLQYGDRAPERVQPIGAPDASDEFERGVDPHDPGATPSVIVARAERHERLARLLAELSPRERRLVELREIQQLDWDEVVVRAGEPTKKAAQQCLARAMARLAERRSEIDDELDEPT
jgi:RNA polymerase sigma-70 factor (ECF subfamily)